MPAISAIMRTRERLTSESVLVRRFPIHRPHDFEVVIETTRDRDHADDQQHGLMLSDGGVEDEKFAEKSGGKWNSCERSHREEHGEGEKRRTGGQAVEILDLIAGLIRHHDEDGETQHRHEQIGDEIKTDRDPDNETTPTSRYPAWAMLE